MVNDQVKKQVVIAPSGGPTHGKGMVQGIKPAGLFSSRRFVATIR